MKPLRRSALASSLALALALAAGACKSPPPPEAPPPPPPVTPRAPEIVVPPLPVASAPVVIGMADPFARLDGAAMKALGEGWGAVRKKQPADARKAFHAVVAAYPDKPATRYQELKAAALAGDLVAVPGLWRELLARDFVGYAERLEQDKELAPLRKSPAWPELLAIKGEVKARYTRGLDKGFVFVARTRPPAVPVFEEGEGTAKLDLDQEAYHFDPTTRRVRRLTDTGGRVVAVHRDDTGGRLLVLTVKALRKVEEGTAFKRPEASLLSLDTLERIGPIEVDTDAVSVGLCVSPRGEPVWTVDASGAKAFTLDATGTSLVPMDEACGPEVATTLAAPTGVTHQRPAPEGVALSADGLQLTGVDPDRPVRASAAVRPGSFGWSPGKKRFVYTGAAERCDLVAQIDGKLKPARNAVQVWDAGRRTAARVAWTVSPYETAWLDDDRLVYEAGLDQAPKLTIHDLSGAGPPFALKAPAGAGLFGLAALACPRTEVQALAR